MNTWTLTLQLELISPSLSESPIRNPTPGQARRVDKIRTEHLYATISFLVYQEIRGKYDLTRIHNMLIESQLLIILNELELQSMNQF